jgi:antitoxin MazE
MEAKIVQMGRSKGVKIPKRLLAKYDLGDTVVLREVDDGLLIEKKADDKLSWAETYKAMAESDEDWSDWADMDLESME